MEGGKTILSLLRRAEGEAMEKKNEKRKVPVRQPRAQDESTLSSLTARQSARTRRRSSEGRAPACPPHAPPRGQTARAQATRACDRVRTLGHCLGRAPARPLSVARAPRARACSPGPRTPPLPTAASRGRGRNQMTGDRINLQRGTMGITERF